MNNLATTLRAHLPAPIKKRLNRLKVWLIRRRQVGRGTYIDPTAQVLGWQHVQIGHHTTLCEGVCINVNHRRGPELSVIIGDNCFIGRRNFITSGAPIRFGDYCLTGVDCHFIGAGHSITDPFIPFVLAEVESYGALTLGVNSWLGSRVTVLRGVHIGFGAVVGANALVTRDLPPLCVAAGQPARIVELYDLEARTWKRVSEQDADFAARLQGHLASLPTENDYLSGLRARYPTIKIPAAVAGISGGEV